VVLRDWARRSGLALAGAVSLGGIEVALAQEEEASGDVYVLPTVQVTAQPDSFSDGPFLPAVDGAHIHAGKKTDNIVLDRLLPKIANDNYRQALITTPGLILSEETNPLVSIGYRGYNPHRTQYFQVLQNGFPIHADMFGYPEAYYTPPLDAVERIEVVRGGAALMYGPQPAGAINFVMKRPPLDTPFSLTSINTVGSFNTYTNFSMIGGTVGDFGYLGWYNHRESDGFREANSDYFLNAWNATLAYGAATDARTFLMFDFYDETHGEPGGLTLSDGPDAVNYTEDRNGTSRFFDRFRLSRYAVMLLHENDVSEDTFVSFRAWWNYYRRYSRRQRGGGFGTLPTGPASETNSIQTQTFYTWGVEPRVRHHYELFGQEHTFTGGMMLYHTTSPRIDARGDSPTAMRGPIRTQSNRQTWYYSIFAENRFTWGPLSVTPGVRLENYWLGVKELRNVAKSADGVPLANETEYRFAPLFGIGAELELARQVQLYGNVSTAYRPPIFTEAITTSPEEVVAGNLDASYVWNYELGFRGSPTTWANWDTSVWVVDFADQIGSVVGPGDTTVIENSGRSVTWGWDLAVEMDLIGLADAIWNPAPAEAPAPLAKGGKQVKEVVVPPHTSWTDTYGSLTVFNALTLMGGEFVSGPNQGNVPQYTPDYLYRLGIVYNWRDRIKVGLTSTFVGSSFATNDESPQRFIPAYDVWDLTVEAKVYEDYVSIIGGVNNLFDRDYYSRIRSSGIDPAYPRNWYAGVKVEF